MSLGKIAVSIALVALLLPLSGCGDDSGSDGPNQTDADVATDADVGTDADAASDPDATEDSTSGGSQCSQAGGVCTDGFPDEIGYTVMCPPDYVLEDGRTSVTNGGIDIIQSDRYGCARSSGGTSTPSLCCFPAENVDADAGSD